MFSKRYRGLLCILFYLPCVVSLEPHIISTVKCCAHLEVLVPSKTSASKLDCLTKPERYYNFQSNILAKPLNSLSYKEMIILKEITHQVSVNCVDFFVDSINECNYPRLVGVIMNFNKKEPNVDLQSVMKVKNYSDLIEQMNICCKERNSYFNYTTRECTRMTKEKNIQNLVKFYAPFVEVLHENLNCQGAMVDYEVKMEEIFREDDNLKIKWKGRNIILPKSPKEHCIDIGTSIGNSSSTVVVRMCVPRNYCTRNVCVSKCSAFDSRVELVGKNISSLRKNNQSFHSFLKQSKLKSLENIQPSLMKEHGLSTNFDHCKTALFVKNNWHMTYKGFVIVNNQKKIYKSHRYCIDIVDRQIIDKNGINNTKIVANANEEHDIIAIGKGDVILYVCTELVDQSLTLVAQFRGILLITSCVFMLITIFVIILVPSFNNLYGKCLLQHSISYLVAFFCKSLVHFRMIKGHEFCLAWGYTSVFFSYGIFTWLNLLSYLIWNGIGRQLRVKLARDRQNKRKTFYKFCLYGWGLPILMILFVFLLNISEPFDKYYLPEINAEECWFPRINNVGEFLYYAVPTSMLLFLNIIFFTWTIINFNRVKLQVTHIMNKQSAIKIREVYKKQFYINLKLLFVMGIPLIGETIASYLWRMNNYAFDGLLPAIFEGINIVNSLQGVVLFFIIVYKRKVLKELKKYRSMKAWHDWAKNNQSTTGYTTTSMGPTSTTVGR